MGCVLVNDCCIAALGSSVDGESCCYWRIIDAGTASRHTYEGV